MDFGINVFSTFHTWLTTKVTVTIGGNSHPIFGYILGKVSAFGEWDIYTICYIAMIILIFVKLFSKVKMDELLEAAVEDLAQITGQKPVVTKAKKAIAGFKVREGQPIGCKVTLRGENMYNFLDKLISITLPRVRDFRGVSHRSFDGRGNYTLGLTEQLIFSEIDYDNVVKVRGMDIVFVTTAKTNDEAYDLLKGFGMPFKN